MAEPDANGWYSMDDAPRRNEQHILLFTTDNGQAEAYFSPGQWHDHWELGPQYDGPVWVCGDDEWQIEVEEWKNDNGVIEFHDGNAIAWRHLHAPPIIKKEPEAEPNAEAWPNGCSHPNSCSRHRECMYSNCRHRIREIGDEIDAALIAMQE